jgi:two-component system OmpR family sensor kinase
MVYRTALAEADAFFDYHLRQTALVLRDQPVEYLLRQDIPDTTIGFSTAVTTEGRWRVFGVQALTRVIQVAQPMRVREQQAVQLALRTLTPFALLMPLLVILIWVAVGRALEPLQRLTLLVKARKIAALDPLPDRNLPGEVQPLVGALNDLLGRLGAALERERGFMADAAHELRTPLTALYLQLGTLSRAENETERATAMEELHAGVQRAIRLVEQLLSLARQGPRVEPTRHKLLLAELARDVVAEMVPLADAKHIDLGISTSQPACVLGDTESLRTLIRNLVDNAVRYTPSGGRVDVSVEQLNEPEKRGAVLRIVDTGPGIPPEERERVFDRFYRLPGTSPPGSGLGMAIVKTIAAAHQATVTLHSGPGGQGLEVTVSFPAGPA